MNDNEGCSLNKKQESYILPTGFNGSSTLSSKSNSQLFKNQTESMKMNPRNKKLISKSRRNDSYLYLKQPIIQSDSDAESPTLEYNKVYKKKNRSKKLLQINQGFTSAPYKIESLSSSCELKNKDKISLSPNNIYKIKSIFLVL